MLDFARNAEEQQRLLKAYRSHNEATHDQLIRAFPGIVDELAALRAEGFEMGVVTSKMHALAWRGLQVVGAAPYLGCLIGDSPFDIAAGNAAGCKTLAVTWGMFPEEKLVVENPTEIIHEVAEFSVAIQALSN